MLVASLSERFWNVLLPPFPLKTKAGMESICALEAMYEGRPRIDGSNPMLDCQWRSTNRVQLSLMLAAVAGENEWTSSSVLPQFRRLSELPTAGLSNPKLRFVSLCR